MSEQDSIHKAERLAFAHEQLKFELMHFMKKPGTFSSGIPGVGCARRDLSGVSEHRFDRPLVSVLVQGSKESTIGNAKYNLAPGQILTVCMDMPSSSRILQASPSNPLLTFFFYLNQEIIRDMLCEVNNSPAHINCPNGVSVTNCDADFMESLLRLAIIMNNPGQIAGRAEIALRDLHYLLLTGPQATILRDVYADGRYGNHLNSAISYLKEHLNSIVTIKNLARAANMSESSLYRHFKKLTGLSPMQYHKQMRLHEARRLLFGEREQIAVIAYKIGYESVSQFNRDYKKLFGVSPKRSLSTI